MKTPFLPIITLFLLSSCYRPITIKLSRKEPEIYTNAGLKQILAKKSPSLVLRKPTTSIIISESNEYDAGVVYNTIEKEFLKSGFTVRDRTIFEKILLARYDLDYSKMKDLSNTDLVFEVLDIKKRTIKTNNYYTPKGILRRMKYEQTFQGWAVEFRIINIKENEIVGNYTFYYIPCSDAGCSYALSKDGRLYLPQSKTQLSPNYETMTEDTWEEFARHFTRTLIAELHK